MHLLFVLYSLRGGGAERVTSILANHWASEGHEITLVTFTGTTDDFYELDPEIRRIRINLTSLSTGPIAAIGFNLERILALRKLLLTEQPDVAISMMSTANVLLAIASLGLRRLIKLGSERIHPPELPLGRTWSFLRWFSYGFLDAIVAQTKLSAVWIRSHTLSRRVVVIENPLSPFFSNRPPLVSPAELVMPHERLLLAVGRLDYQKGFDLLLEAFSTIAAAHPSWKLVILGEGKDRHLLECMRLKAGLEHRVALPGWAGNISEWYHRANLFVLSSRFEGFPNVLAEAMAAGLPVVSTNCPTGPGDLVIDGVSGLLVPVNDPVGLAQVLDTLMADDMARQALATEARRLSARLELGSIATNWERLFSKAV